MLHCFIIIVFVVLSHHGACWATALLGCPNGKAHCILSSGLPCLRGLATLRLCPSTVCIIPSARLTCHQACRLYQHMTVLGL